VPMQPLTAPPRDQLTAAQIRQLLQDEPAIVLTGGLEIVDIDLNVVEDISDHLAGGSVSRDSYAVMHGTARFQISRVIDWGGDLLRPYLTISGGGIEARWNLGVYHPTTPDWPLEEDPPTFDVEGYDLLLRLNQPVGDAYAIAAGQSYLTAVEAILTARGYTQYLIDWERAATVAPSSRVWAFDDQITWLTIVNDLLGAVGYAGIWSDWDGRLRVEPYQPPLDRAAEWAYSDDQAITMMSTRRTVIYDFFAAPNRWVIYRNNTAEGAAPVEGNGLYTYVNQSVGDTSVDARRGLVITKTEGVDVADHTSLLARAQQIIDADMAIPVLYQVETAPNPVHWHFDRLLLQDSASIPVADVMGTQWTLPLPPDGGDMTHQWRILLR
jgi:hypothetical protein